ncbi:amidase family protein [Chelativorans salis]|uniref:Amidase family protein n=1 Tax=Chelativorans salis TaxID=2978478 RepID=A0ABT2LU06_9HYPH|nr:amidase family protein [Chelativorans sp. EGI FJ00035]MCT7378008.1 amidase family protein [Chelativorans sp. EGI FJ00035]
MNDIIAKAKEAIAKVEGLGDETGRIFTAFDPDRILADASALEARRNAGEEMPLYGMLISIKDLFDEEGRVTSAGSKLLKNAPPADKDATVVARLKAAGALCFGRTSMSEFAYSGVGLNPHYGTPESFFGASRIPGGSSSGAALTVAHGLCDAGLGTDTGGSVRIPAAVNGLYGYKPSQAVVSREGVHPLSDVLDSVGPLCADLEGVLLFMRVLGDGLEPRPAPNRPLRLAVPVNAFVNDIDAFTRDHFKHTCDQLRQAGHDLAELDLGFLPEALGLNRIIIASEAHALYRDHLDELESVGDPRVLKRIRFAETLSAADLENALQQRAQVVRRFTDVMKGCDALIAPTLAIEPPTIAEANENFDAVNAMMLRNCSLINLVDGCAMAMPTKGNGALPGSLMLAGRNGDDAHILGLARALDEVVAADHVGR